MKKSIVNIGSMLLANPLFTQKLTDSKSGFGKMLFVATSDKLLPIMLYGKDLDKVLNQEEKDLIFVIRELAEANARSEAVTANGNIIIDAPETQAAIDENASAIASYLANEKSIDEKVVNNLIDKLGSYAELIAKKTVEAEERKAETEKRKELALAKLFRQ